MPWSPLASGLLSGKYTRAGVQAEGAGRLDVVKNQGNPAFLKLFTERNWKIVDELVAVAKILDRSPSQVALAWVTRRPGVTSTIIGATRPEQLDANLRALELELPPELAARLEEVGRPELVHPYLFFQPSMQGMLSGGTAVAREWPWYRGR
jgi:aryl-alcohol dehydrogenase-like predicted oxidoreductase